MIILQEATSTDGGGVDGTALRRALEWELSLDSRDLRSHAWYHGSIGRIRAEEIVQKDGDFLIRDCSSAPGSLVLTCRVKTQPLHFVINKLLVQPDTVYERVQYQFEDDAYDTIPDLITFYVGSGKPITTASGARIQHPCNRTYPLSFYATRYPAPPSSVGSGPHSRIVSPVGSISPAFRCSAAPSPSPNRCGPPPPRLPSKKQRSHSLTPSEQFIGGRVAATAAGPGPQHEKCNSADGVIQQSPNLMTRSIGPHDGNLKFSTHSLPRSSCNRMSISPSSLSIGGRPPLATPVQGRCMSRVTSDPSLSPCAERRHFSEENNPDSPPPKPSRHPSILGPSGEGGPAHGCLQRLASYHASGSDSGNGSGDSAHSSAAGDVVPLDAASHRASGVVIKNPRYVTCAPNGGGVTLTNHAPFDYIAAEERLMANIPPIPQHASKFDVENFATLLLPSVDNKPLDNNALRSIKMTLQDTAPRVLANHLTRVDLDLIYGNDTSKVTIDKINSTNGIELCGLPHGHQLRMDLIER